jgi:ABC-type uncharacterized transport system substrate-binding protein
MITRLFRTILAAFALLAIAGGAASAHPHVWVTMKSEVIYAPDGTVTGVRHAWTFDDMFSAFATQGLESKEKGKFTREELAPLAEVNVTSLKEFDFFTRLRADGKKATLSEPKKGEYWLEYSNSQLTLHFTLALKTPVKATQLEFETYDPTYYVDFALVEKDPIVLAGAPANCKLTVVKPKELTIAQGRALSESFFNQLDAGSSYGAAYASKISVKCR